MSLGRNKNERLTEDRLFLRALHAVSGYESASLRVQIFNTLSLFASFMGFTAAVISVLLELSPRLIAANFAFGVLMAFFFWLSRLGRMPGAAAVMGLVVLIFFYLPVLWIFNGGTLGIAPLFVIFFSSVLCSLKTVRDDIHGGKWPILFFTLSTVALAGGLTVLELRWPHLIEGYATREGRLADIFVTLMAVFITNYIIITVFMNRYYETLGRVETLSEKYQELAIRDSMTLLYNHEKIMELLEQETARAARYSRPLALMIIDIDNFKSINDTHGHSFGDEVIMAIAQSLTANCRVNDHVGRYGGEEFMIIFPETGMDAAITVAQRLRESFGAAALSRVVAVTFSGGLAGYAGENADVFVNRADRMLYEAKNSGKNRIQW